jgi:hypothetical protein
MAAPVPHFISSEMLAIDMSVRSLSHARKRAPVAMIRTETVIDVAPEMGMAVKPRASSDEYAVVKPFRTVIAVRSTAVRREVVVAIWTGGSDANEHAHPCLSFGGGGREADADTDNCG